MSVLIRQRTAPHEGLWTRLDQRGRIMVILMIAAAVAVMGAQGTTLARALIGLAGLVVFVVIAFAHRDTALVMLVVWIVLLGFIRRFLIPFAGWSENDPLLLVGPAAAITFLLASRDAASRRPHTPMSGCAAFLTLWSALQIFNPNEDSLLTASQGAMFFVVPMLWFFVGRTLTDAQHEKIVNAVFWVAIAVVGHGLYQTFVDILPFEYTWVGVSNQNAAIFLPGFKIRPFSTLTSPQEYGQFLSFALLIIWAKILYAPKGGPSRWLVAFFVVSAVAIFYQGTRTSFLFFLLAFAITTVVRFRSVALLLLILVGGAGLTQWVGAQDVQEVQASQGEAVETSDALASHTLAGLTNPGNSTLPLHIELIEKGLTNGIREPFGSGVSRGTIAAKKAEEVEGPSAENDVANVMETLGAPAGFAYLTFIFAGFAAAIRLQRRRPSARHLAYLGLLIGATTQWWSGQLYATSTILFLALGGLARESAELHEADRVKAYERIRSAAVKAGQRVRVPAP